MRRRAMICAAVMLAAEIAVPALSQDQTDKKPPAPEMKMPPEAKAWIEASMPGPQHKLLNYCIGRWQTTERHWMQPGQPAQVSSGTCESTWVLGGRYVKTTYQGNFMGMRFAGIGYTGYDNVTKQYVSTWMDNMSTGILRQTGTYDPEKRLFTFKSQMPTPGGDMIRQVETVRVIDDDHHVMTFYHQIPKMDKPVKVMEITYSRAKKASQTQPPKP